MKRGLSGVATVLFTDIVDSTRIAAELGDARWRTLVERHHAVIRSNVKRFRGREMDTAGDGFFVAFERPGDAIACAVASLGDVQVLGIDLRAGIHTGEVQSIDAKAGGITVAVGARIASLGHAAQVLITSTTRDLSIGAALDTVDRGEHELKGVPGRWRAFEVTRVRTDLAPPQPLDDATARERRSSILAADAPRHRPVVIGALAAAAAIAVTVVALVLADHGPDRQREPAPAEGANAPPLNSLAAFDADSGDLVEWYDIPLNGLPGVWPRTVTTGEGAVWVGDVRDVFRVRPGSGAEADRVHPNGYNISSVIAAFRTLWIGSYADNLERRNPSTLDALAGIEISPSVSPTTGIPTTIPIASMAAGERGIWVSLTDGTLVRIDPQTLGITRLGTIGMAAAAMTIGDGSVWIVDDFAPALHQVDAGSGALIQSVPVGAVPDEIAYVGGAVWLLDTGGGTLARVTPGETAPAPAESIGTDPVDLAVGLDDLWVADQAGNAVLRVEPVNGEVISTIDVGNPVAAVALDESGERDLVWVLVAEPQQHD